jgi:hypothetical protein
LLQDGKQNLPKARDESGAARPYVRDAPMLLKKAC